jgi:hypothetical protein
MVDDGMAIPRSPTRQVMESVRTAVAAVRSELWRDHAVRMAERAVADQWLGHLRDRMLAGFEEWQAVRRERQKARHLLKHAEAAGDDQRAAALRSWAEQATTAEWNARQHYRVIADAIITETTRVREAMIEMNQQHLAQLEDGRSSIDAALRLPPAPPPINHRNPGSGPLPTGDVQPFVSSPPIRLADVRSP